MEQANFWKLVEESLAHGYERRILMIEKIDTERMN